MKKLLLFGLIALSANQALSISSADCNNVAFLIVGQTNLPYSLPFSYDDCTCSNWEIVAQDYYKLPGNHPMLAKPAGC